MFRAVVPALAACLITSVVSAWAGLQLGFEGVLFHLANFIASENTSTRVGSKFFS